MDKKAGKFLDQIFLQTNGKEDLNKIKILLKANKLNRDCYLDHDFSFTSDLEELCYGLYKRLDDHNGYIIEESLENLKFIYNLKQLKKGYKFGNLPETGEEEGIKNFYAVISEKSELLNEKEIDLMAKLIHYFNSSDDWIRVNYMHYFTKH
jgi:hypothetical protein